MTNNPYEDLVPGDGVPGDGVPGGTTPVTPAKPSEKEPNMNGKPIIKSKTFWVNLATAVAGVLATLGGSELIQDNPQVAGIFATVIGVANVLLRLVTKEPVSITGK